MLTSDLCHDFSPCTVRFVRKWQISELSEGVFWFSLPSLEGQVFWYPLPDWCHASVNPWKADSSAPVTPAGHAGDEPPAGEVTARQGASRVTLREEDNRENKGGGPSLLNAFFIFYFFLGLSKSIIKKYLEKLESINEIKMCFHVLF